jgi:hypothetical protein
MALRPKTAVLQMRVDPQLLALFQQACDARDWTVSATLRNFMVNEVEGYRVHLAKKEAARRAQEASILAAGGSVSPVSQKRPEEAAVVPEGPVARRMRLKEEAKLRRQVDHDFDDDDDE